MAARRLILTFDEGLGMLSAEQSGETYTLERCQ